ncbi:O-antigen ligase family protein [Phocaeicola plebeius]|nr:O-antigen ligase family protein [Phocaeicola plebeius]
MKAFIVFKETKMQMDFTAPIENIGGLYFPTILVCLFPLINKRKYRWKWGNTKYVIWIIIFFFIYSYLSPYNIQHSATNVALIVFIQIVFTIYMCKSYIGTNTFIIACYDAFKIILFIELIISLSFVLLHINTLQQLFIPELEGAVVEREGSSFLRASGTTGWPNRLGALCTLIAIFYWICYLRKYKTKQSFWLLVTSIFIILLSQSRSALLACLLSMAISTLVFLHKKHKLSLKKIISLAILTSITIIILLNLPIVQEMFFKSDAEEMTEARFIHYLLGYNIALETNFIGTGINSHTHFMCYNMNNRILGDIWLYQHSIHNIHLVILAELGILGLIIWILYLVSRIIKILKLPLSKMNNPIIWLSFFSMILTIIIHGFTDIMYIHYQYLLIISLFGMYSSTYTKQ